MDLDSLRFANFSDLDSAITDWEQMVTKLKTLQDDAKKDLKAKSDKANWAGDNATITRTFVDKTAGEFADAHTQAESITNILTDTRGELVGYRTQLNDAIGRGALKNLTVRDTGEGSFTVTMNIHPDRAAKGTTVPEHTQADVDAFRDEIQAILKNATESDTSAAKVLNLLVEQATYGFSGAKVADRDSGAKAVEEAEKMAKIAKKDPHDVTPTELNTLNTTLAAYKDNPLFAEQFATQAGPKKLLQFYAGIADPYQGYGTDPKQFEQAKLLQKNLGITLGTATLSDSDKMQNWESKMVKLGPDRLGIDDANDPTGFGVMSNLMRFGDYDDQFLNDYGDKLIAYDKERNIKGMSPWINNWNQADLNFYGKDDRGRDPMNGFMEALGHNPEAATQFFAQPEGAGATVDKEGEVNEHLKYLTKDRIWLPDATLDGNSKTIAGHDSLGHALEAATTGYAYDSDPMSGKDPMIPGNADHRTAETAGVMEQVAFLYGSEDGPKMLHEQPQLADSLGKMGAAYIDDIDYSLSGVGDHAKDDGAFPARYAGRANFGEQGAIDFLSVLGQDEKSHAGVTTAQHLYTLSALDAHPATSDVEIDRAKAALMTGAEARGILDHSRVQQAETTYTAESEEANKSLARSGDWIELGTGVVVGGGIAAIPLPGSTPAALVLAPLAAETAGDVLNTFVGHQVEKGLDGAEKDPTEQAQLTSRGFYQKGANELGGAYNAYLESNPKWDRSSESKNWAREIEFSYLGTGAGQDDYRGRAPYKD
ncbi:MULTISPECIES: DUF6571 family protein [unclassified Streptomyces]|uniref:DUF6571 family protein n=1 Tax=unclassified Streptomyces TaxID=2593676 RepID=UPI00048C0150|nr:MULTISPECIES: DUF6571 family protein [unclassified Streptomyces]MYY17221.1 hypothetical protein [Streptomyces sp. SID4912]SCD52370.1 hypothetical protein GA0115241_103018 [Streptomyces sp. DpondAA-D4]